MIKNLEINGFRGFGKKQTIQFAQPNGELGSGLTFIVGSNNTGKTTILECLKFFNSISNSRPSMSERKRNTRNQSRVEIKLIDCSNNFFEISTVKNGGSETDVYINNLIINDNNRYENREKHPKIFILQSRRAIDYEFHRIDINREDYLIQQQSEWNKRSHILRLFNARMFSMQKNKDEFDPLLKRILGQDLDWYIEQNENGTYYLKLDMNGVSHSSEGLGDGIWGVFTLCDALYDSNEGSVIAIDEPELSLHPAYQKRVMEVIKEYSKDRQIIISTHSPYFIDWESIINGAELIRTTKNSDGDIEIFRLSEKSKCKIKGFVNDYHQPHTLGLEAKEVFFLEDNIVLVEGQEDAIAYPQIANQLSMVIKGNIFGWGVGGAPKMEYIINILKDLGYKKVCIILDGDRKKDSEELSKNFPEYSFFTIPTDDVRDKGHIDKPNFTEGIVNSRFKVKEKYKGKMKSLINDINSKFA